MGNPVLSSVALAVQPAPLPTLYPTAVYKDGFVKVRLSFLTNEPKHVRSQTLQRICGSQPPFVEDICVLIPQPRAFAILEAYLPAWEYLREAEIVPPAANLLNFKVMDEDITTLAYLFE